MFIDYYDLLEITPDVTQKEISVAYKKQAKKWHPDKNPYIDTTKRMQQINEAYLILNDIEARQKYDKEYARFSNQRQQANQQHNNTRHKQTQTATHDYEYAYEVQDDTLYKWIMNARRQAVVLAKQTLEDVQGMLTEGAKAATNSMVGSLIGYAVFSVVVLIIFLLAKAC